MAHEIIVPYRNRPKALRSFLTTLPICESIEITIVDLGSSKDETEAILKAFNHTTKHMWFDFPSTFSRSFALNRGIEASQAEYVTIFDIDCIFHANPIPSILAFRGDNKMSWRLHHIDHGASQKIMTTPTWSPDFSRYMNHVDETHGTSHLTVARKKLVEVGMYDEEFKSWGFEDIDLNLRLHRIGVQTIINKSCPIYHLSHKYEPDWKNEESYQKNKSLFLLKSS